MVLFFIGASSLDNAQKAFDYKQRSLERTVKTQRGLSLNPKSSKTVQALLEREAVLKEASGLILWHDVISNTIGQHPWKNIPPCPTEDLVEILKDLRNQVKAIIYVRREGNPEICEELKTTGIPIIEVEKRLVTPWKKNSVDFQQDIHKPHPDPQTEIKIFQTVVDHLGDLETLSKAKKNRPCQQQRKRHQKRK